MCFAAFCCDPVKSCKISQMEGGRPQWKIQVLKQIVLVIQQIYFSFINIKTITVYHIRQNSGLLEVLLLKLDFMLRL